MSNPVVPMWPLVIKSSIEKLVLHTILKKRQVNLS